MKAFKVLALGLASLLALLALGVGIYWLRLQRFVATPYGSAAEKIVEVLPGATLAETSRNLEVAGVVADGERFYLYGRLQKAERKIRRGEYGFSGSLTPSQVLSDLVLGKVKLHRVTVPEGLRVEEIAPLFEQAGVAESKAFLSAARDPALLRKLGIPAPTAEGFLFPDTYLLPKGRRPATIVEEMVAHYRDAYARARTQADPSIQLTELQAVTLASIIEKETAVPEERPRISCVFHNRLRLGMRLQTDPTVIYAVLLAEGSFDGNLTKKMLLTPHPYNTYTSFGLPPGPIANPGYEALAAALRPASCRDLYFVSRGDGHHAFCPDLACHNANVQRFQIAPARRAGR